MFTVNRFGNNPASFLICDLQPFLMFYCQQLKAEAFQMLQTKAKQTNVKQMCLFAGSNCSSSSEGETTPTALHAGICVRQQSVSIKDAIIAREALSLLVTCLQLRCQQLCKTHAGAQTHCKHTHSLFRHYCTLLLVL